MAKLTLPRMNMIFPFRIRSTNDISPTWCVPTELMLLRTNLTAVYGFLLLVIWRFFSQCGAVVSVVDLRAVGRGFGPQRGYFLCFFEHLGCWLPYFSNILWTSFYRVQSGPARNEPFARPSRSINSPSKLFSPMTTGTSSFSSSSGGDVYWQADTPLPLAVDAIDIREVPGEVQFSEETVKGRR